MKNLAILPLVLGVAAAHAQVKIGVLSDMSSLYAAIDGPGSVVAAKMAADDFGGKVLGQPIEIVSADHQNKADVGTAIANRWFDTEGVDVIADLPNSSVSLAVQNLAKGRGKIVLISGAGTTDLTGKACSPTGVHWTWDTYALGKGTAEAVQSAGNANKWFFITADFAFGHSMEKEAGIAVKRNGGQVVGAVRVPFNTADFSSFLIQAQGAKADVVALANAGNDSVNAIKQAEEYGITKRQKLVAMYSAITDLPALGLQAAQGLYLTTAFYWDRDDASRAWAKRFFEKHKAMPTMEQAGVYSSISHYLKAVAAAKSKDPAKVMEQMRNLPVNDFFAKNGRVRADGRMVHDMYLMQVKAPSESKYPWDFYKLIKTIPGEQAFRPLKESECALVK
jgi:branched-chain amino acid transport system substrate-binding protein